MLDHPRGHPADDKRSYKKNLSGAIAERFRSDYGADTGRERGGLHIDSDFRRIVSKCQASKRGRIKEVYGILSKISRIKTASKPYRNRIETVPKPHRISSTGASAYYIESILQTLAGWVGGANEAIAKGANGRPASQRTPIDPRDTSKRWLGGWAERPKLAMSAQSAGGASVGSERAPSQPAHTH